jgi:hypothetical protein
MSNIDNLVYMVNKNQHKWQMPEDMISKLRSNHERLKNLFAISKTINASEASRAERNSLLNETVFMCRTEVKVWAYGKYAESVMTAEDVYSIGFILPGDIGGHRKRSAPTDAIANVKVIILSYNAIRVIIDNSTNKNAALVKKGWPPGVRLVQIVIHADDGKTEIMRLSTSRLNSTIRMPEGSNGKAFIISAAFLRHVEDKPNFGAAKTFSMPLTTVDIVADTYGKRLRENYDLKVKEVEELRLKVAQLESEIKVQK